MTYGMTYNFNHGFNGRFYSFKNPETAQAWLNTETGNFNERELFASVEDMKSRFKELTDNNFYQDDILELGYDINGNFTTEYIVAN